MNTLASKIPVDFYVALDDSFYSSGVKNVGDLTNLSGVFTVVLSCRRSGISLLVTTTIKGSDRILQQVYKMDLPQGMPLPLLHLL